MVPVSPTLKKCQALHMSQNLEQKKTRHKDPLCQVTVETDNDSDSGRSDISNEYFGIRSPQRDTPPNSNFEATWDPDVTVSISNTDTHINSNDQTTRSIPENTMVMPPGVSHTESNMEEV